MKLAWGKYKAWVEFLTGANKGKTYELPTPIEDSLNLNPSKGEKMEAKIEGGEVEAAKYKPNTYNVELEIRKGNEDDGTVRTLPFEEENGVINEEVKLIVQPEDATVEGFTISRCAVSSEDSFNAKDGAKWKLTFDALKPDTGAYVKWGVITTPTNVQKVTAQGS